MQDLPPDAEAPEPDDSLTDQRRRRRRLHNRKPAPRRKRLSEILSALSQAEGAGTISVGDLLRGMDGRAFGALFLIFAFPNILPSPPGLAGVLGLPLIYLSAQMMLARSPWLPPFIDRRAISRESFRALVGRANPFLERAERLLRARLMMLTSPMAERFLGALCLALSLVLILPIPLGNLLPALSLSIIALGVLERDGIWIIGGVLLSIAAFFWVGGLAYALVKSAIFLIVNAF
jgi:hypothetical protein